MASVASWRVAARRHGQEASAGALRLGRRGVAVGAVAIGSAAQGRRSTGGKRLCRCWRAGGRRGRRADGLDFRSARSATMFSAWATYDSDGLLSGDGYGHLRRTAARRAGGTNW